MTGGDVTGGAVGAGSVGWTLLDGRVVVGVVVVLVDVVVAERRARLPVGLTAAVARVPGVDRITVLARAGFATAMSAVNPAERAIEPTATARVVADIR